MGCDIHAWAEKRVPSPRGERWDSLRVEPSPFEWRSYSVFAFLAGVRNYSAIEPIEEPRGFPTDAGEKAQANYERWNGDAHTPSWLTIEELEAFNYERMIEDRRVTIDGDGGRTAAPGGGRKMTYRDFLDEGFFTELARLKAIGAERIVFWFDN
jgi:hypothetical protein